MKENQLLNRITHKNKAIATDHKKLFQHLFNVSYSFYCCTEYRTSVWLKMERVSLMENRLKLASNPNRK